MSTFRVVFQRIIHLTKFNSLSTPVGVDVEIVVPDKAYN